MRSTPPEDDAPSPTRTEIDAAMSAARVFVGVCAQSVASVEDRVTLPQLRVLVMVANKGPQNLASVAQTLGVHPSNATRRCDKLVDAGLLHRSEDPADRRNLILQLTRAGRQLVGEMTAQRRAAIEDVLDKMPAPLRRDLVLALVAFAQAAGELSASEAWSLGWSSEQPNGSSQVPSSTPCG